MWRGAVALLAWLCAARASPAAADHALRSHIHSMHTTKELAGVLGAIEDKLRVLDAVSAAQAQTARRLDVIQDKLDRVESTLSLRLERAQLAAERLEHRLHMLQTSVQATIDESSKRLEHSQAHIAAIAQNLTNHLDTHRHLLEKVSGAYVETWRRGLVLESLMRDGLSLVNATRRELADGLRALARRQRDSRHTSAEFESAFTKRLNDNTHRIDLKVMQEVLDAQKRFVDLCQRVQLDDPTHVTDVLDKLMNSLINKTASTFQELQSIQVALRYHDNRIMKLLSTSRVGQSSDGSCRRLEAALRNVTQTSFKETELHQLTEKFVALTDRADAALQRLEARLADDPAPSSDITSDADRLFSKLNSIRSEEESYDDEDWEEDEQSAGYFDDSGGGDIMGEDKTILTKGDRWSERRIQETTTVRSSHRRHLHKHPYDRGPVKRNET
ncbi:hypothetical protein EVAR_19649_1 [Eumeta japonica]|uniref:Uncharacterized protein n=1 Tax=Eumeta variegata TaxID=151549 RepID=A0A4C1V1V7_EUMVA|nr:hypothetical protein EVAR_19649_1 [Eumeta japonica]